MKERTALVIAALLAVHVGIARAAPPAAEKEAAASRLEVTYYYLPG